ncbi:MAG: plasmid partitioning protein RepA [Pseudomonadota bacterium]
MRLEGLAEVAADAEALSSQIRRMRARLFAPGETKTLRPFTSAETARLLGVSDSYLRHLARAGEGPAPATAANGRRVYTLEQIHALRAHLAAKGEGKGGRVALPRRRPGDHLQVLAVTNFKGGSGKTTTSAHLAQHLALRGYRTLAVDLDPQASLTSLFGCQPEADLEPGQTVYGAIRYDDPKPLASLVRPTYMAGLDLVPGHLELHEFEHDTPRVLARREAAGAPFYARLAGALQSVEADYDVVVLDCPPQLGFLTLGALCAATGVLVTVHPQMLDIASMSQFLAMTSELMGVVEEAGAKVELDFLRYVVTRHEPSDGPQAQVVGFLRGLFGDRVLTHTMLKSTAMADAGLTKQTLYETGRDGMTRSTYERAIDSLEAVNGEIEGLVRRAWGREGAEAEAINALGAVAAEMRRIAREAA